MPTVEARRAELEELLGQRMDVALPRLREMVRSADRSTLDAMLACKWFQTAKWRSKAGITFWVNSYFIALRFGTAAGAEHFEGKVDRVVNNPEHETVDDVRRFVALALRRLDGRHAGPAPANKVPKTKAKLKAYIEGRLGDSSWGQIDALVELAVKPRFSLESLDGLWLLTALMQHGSATALRPLLEENPESPLLQQLLAHVGAAPSEDEDPRGAELLDAVWADPGVEEPRAVYADWLMERGDARGRFIAAQLAGKSPKVKPMVLVNWTGFGPLVQWRPPFASQRPSYRVIFRSGFISGVRVSGLDGEAAERSPWSTVEVLDVEGDIDGLGRVALPSLRALGNLSARELDVVYEEVMAVLRHD